MISGTKGPMIFDKNDITKNIMISRKKRPVPPSFFDNNISSETDNVILKSLELDIEKRYNNGIDFLDAIKEIEQLKL